LLGVDPANPGSALPALDLAACVRSETTIGEVALGIVSLAKHDLRRQPGWWQSLFAGLQPKCRRNGAGNAGDHYKTAIRVVQLHAPWLIREEAEAMRTGLSREGSSYGSK